MGASDPVTLDDVRTAATVLDGVVHHTPVVTSRTLDGWTGGRLLLKAESLQRGGAFKLRGAYHAVTRLPATDRARGVAAVSSGNHAQAIALAASLHGVAATILMPTDAPAGKLAATRGYGAEVVTYDRYADDRDALGRALADRLGVPLIPPFDDPAVVAGQGTVALELVHDVDELDLLVVPVGGGGLLAGCAAAAAGLRDGLEVVGVEPAARHAGREAMRRDRPVRVEVARTILDGQQTTAIGAHPLRVISRHVDRIVGVTDTAVVGAMRALFERTKLVVEPSGAAALAAVLDGVVPVAGRRVGVVLSGGNIDLERFRALTT